MNQSEEREQSMKTANQTGIYKEILVGVLVCMVGVYGRFAFDSQWLSLATWIVLFFGSYLCCKAVFKILNAK